MGLELNAVKTYKIIIDGVDRGNTVTKVLEEVTSGVFKTGTIEPGNSEPTFGDYIGVEGNTYHDRGDWDDTPDEPYDNLENTSQGIIMTNPITEGFESDFYGKYIEKETITTPIGKFEAYKFHNHDEGISTIIKGETIEEEVHWAENYYSWFVPYLGIVKLDGEETENGEITYKIKGEIIYYSFATGSLGSTKSKFSTENSSTLNPVVAAKLRKIFRNKK